VADRSLPGGFPDACAEGKVFAGVVALFGQVLFPLCLMIDKSSSRDWAIIAMEVVPCHIAFGYRSQKVLFGAIELSNVVALLLDTFDLCFFFDCFSGEFRFIV
jgi:hypothetical protein